MNCTALCTDDLLQFTKADAGYTATDYVLREVKAQGDCKWLSVTNADNAYGSEVVQRVLHVATDPETLRQPEMLLLPLDSRNFAEQGTCIDR